MFCLCCSALQALGFLPEGGVATSFRRGGLSRGPVRWWWQVLQIQDLPNKSCNKKMGWKLLLLLEWPLGSCLPLMEWYVCLSEQFVSQIPSTKHWPGELPTVEFDSWELFGKSRSLFFLVSLVTLVCRFGYTYRYCVPRCSSFGCEELYDSLFQLLDCNTL